MGRNSLGKVGYRGAKIESGIYLIVGNICGIYKIDNLSTIRLLTRVLLWLTNDINERCWKHKNVCPVHVDMSNIESTRRNLGSTSEVDRVSLEQKIAEIVLVYTRMSIAALVNDPGE